MTSETEIKLRIADLEQAGASVEAQGFRVSASRVFERNIVLDTAAGELRASGHLLRLRQAGAIATITFKGVASNGKHKTREERETGIADFDEMLVILQRLGYRETFSYEKYRTEFRGDSGGVITIDETPVGNFLEIEGEAEWIDKTARGLGFSERDYSVESYGGLYANWCREKGIIPSNMTFSGSQSESDQALSQL